MSPIFEPGQDVQNVVRFGALSLVDGAGPRVGRLTLRPEVNFVHQKTLTAVQIVQSQIAFTLPVWNNVTFADLIEIEFESKICTRTLTSQLTYRIK